MEALFFMFLGALGLFVFLLLSGKLFDDDADLWVNKKTGNLYEVLDEFALDSETNERVVIYRRWDSDGDEQLWVRPRWLFHEKFEPYQE